MRHIHAIGHSSVGAFLDFAGDPVALIVSHKGNVIVGAGVIPEFPIASTIVQSRVRRFELARSAEPGGGWTLVVRYGNESETVLPIGTWTGGYREITSWLERVNDLVGVSSPASELSHVGPDSAIKRVLARNSIFAVPGWAMSSAAGMRTGEYKLPWMNRFLINVSKILVARHEADPALSYEYVERRPEETWLHVFDRLTPRIAKHDPKRAIDVCFEPLFKGPQRGSFEVVTLGYLKSFSVVFKNTSPWLPNFEAAIDAWKKSEAGKTATLEESFDAHFKVFRDTALKEKIGSGQQPPRILTQTGTITSEMVADQITLGNLKKNRTFSAQDTNNLVAEMKRSGEFVVFCDKILHFDLIGEWQKSEGDTLEELIFPLREPVPVGLPFAAGDIEWGRVLREALLTIAGDTDPDIYNSWRQTLNDLNNAEILIDREFIPPPGVHSTAGRPDPP